VESVDEGVETGLGASGLEVVVEEVREGGGGEGVDETGREGGRGGERRRKGGE